MDDNDNDDPKDDSSSKASRIFIAAGPFMPHGEQVNFQPLYDLLAVAMQEKPHVVLLVPQIHIYIYIC